VRIHAQNAVKKMDMRGKNLLYKTHRRYYVFLDNAEKRTKMCVFGIQKRNKGYKKSVPKKHIGHTCYSPDKYVLVE
jgi:hypothetical protein